jgi:phage-related protein
VLVNGIRVYYDSLIDLNVAPLTLATAWVRDDCSKRVSACKVRFGGAGGITTPLPYGGFPGANIHQ